MDWRFKGTLENVYAAKNHYISSVTFRLLTGFATLAIPMVPSSSIIITITILSSLGASTAEVSLLFAVEWIM